MSGGTFAKKRGPSAGDVWMWVGIFPGLMAGVRATAPYTSTRSSPERMTRSSANQQNDGNDDFSRTLRSFPQDNPAQPGARCGNADALPPQAPAGHVHAKAQGSLAPASAADLPGLTEEGLILFLWILPFPSVVLLPYFPNLLPCDYYATKSRICRGDNRISPYWGPPPQVLPPITRRQAGRPTSRPSWTRPMATSIRVLGTTSEPGSETCR